MPSDKGTQEGEVMTTLLDGRHVRLEHISSHGATSMPDFWYDQDRPEWVTLLRGTASIEFEDGILNLKAGDHLVIPQHARHRVSSTSKDAEWLALHFDP